MEIKFYNYMVYAKQYLLLYEMLQIRQISNYNDLPQEIKEKIPLSYDEWLNSDNPKSKKSVVFKVTNDYIH